MTKGAGGEPLQLGSDASFFLSLLLASVSVSVVAKYGEPYLDVPFEPSYAAAALLVALPTAANTAKWSSRAREEPSGLPSWAAAG
mmetsp:Transcript_60701/g.178048  ORF Transcript_60701/g.178048 Transcript_60701/m.178048 type:complete len:85 (-) Transcript_60701:90-344(-)